MKDGKNRVVWPGEFRGGRVRVPGDKSIAQRAAMLGGVAEGISRFRGFPGDGADAAGVLRAMEKLGAHVWTEGEALCVEGTGGRLREPTEALDLGNSATGMRLLAGLCAGQGIRVRLTGDASLRRRPMERIREPLERMGARVRLSEGGTAPLEVSGAGGLHGIEYRPRMASAQVKSCCLLAGLGASGRTVVEETAPTRDHTERLLSAMGAEVGREGKRVWVEGGGRLHAVEMDLPGDFSSAAYWLAAAAASDGGEVTVEGVGLNPLRTGFLDVLRRMGAHVETRIEVGGGGELRGDVTVRGEGLKGTEVGGEEIPRLVDEVPLVAVLGAFAEGWTKIGGAGELRLKESDRLGILGGNLEAAGVRVRGRPDGLEIEGSRGAAHATGTLASHGDHRMAMAMAVLALFCDEPVEIGDGACASTSYPGFWEQLEKLGAKIE